MRRNRRDFIKKTTAMAGAAIVLPGMAMGKPLFPGSKPSLDKFGIQLYTLRDVIPDDPKGTIKQLASYGYKQIEGFEGEQGMFWNMPHKDFRMFLDDLGLTMISSHCNIRENFEEKAFADFRFVPFLKGIN